MNVWFYQLQLARNMIKSFIHPIIEYFKINTTIRELSFFSSRGGGGGWWKRGGIE